MSDLTRQQLCVQLHISESTVRRLEAKGMPTRDYLDRRKRYDFVDVMRWMRRNEPAQAIESAARLPRNYYGGTFRAKTMGRMPAWADKKAIKAIYAEATRLTLETGVLHQVDHIIPITSPYVSGLHVAENLQVLTRKANAEKHNYFEPG